MWISDWIILSVEYSKEALTCANPRENRPNFPHPVKCSLVHPGSRQCRGMELRDLWHSVRNVLFVFVLAAVCLSLMWELSF